MRIRLDPADEYMHSLEEASNFNESMYFNVYDPAVSMGGFFRLGNRANEGYAEMTTCLYLPDGRVAFMFDRPKIEHNDAFDAGGMRFEVVEPFAAQTVTYSGRAVILDDPLVMANPRRAFTESPWTEVEAHLDYYGVSPMMGGEPVNDDGSPLTEDLSGGFARGHYEQHVGARGTIRVGEEAWAIDGYGLRDHSWGPRYWQAPWYYRWLTMNFGDDAGFMVSRIVSQDGRVRMGGVVFEDGAYTHIDHCEVDTEWAGEDTYHQRITARVRAGGKEHLITGDVMTMVPLRNRRTTPDGEQLVTRISEGMTRWEWNGRTGYGLSEYLDQIVDGRPVGADA